VKSVDEVIEIGFRDFIFNDAVSLIEWADVVYELLPSKRYDVYLRFIDGEDEREIEIIKR
jgi:tRNA threonylcarbamoyladenosine biosynthesis protein TsaE